MVKLLKKGEREREELLTWKILIAVGITNSFSGTDVCSFTLHCQFLQVRDLPVRECTWAVLTSRMIFPSATEKAGQEVPVSSPNLLPCITISLLSLEPGALFFPQLLN